MNFLSNGHAKESGKEARMKRLLLDDNNNDNDNDNGKNFISENDGESGNESIKKTNLMKIVGVIVLVAVLLTIPISLLTSPNRNPSDNTMKNLNKIAMKSLSYTSISLMPYNNSCIFMSTSMTAMIYNPLGVNKIEEQSTLVNMQLSFYYQNLSLGTVSIADVAVNIKTVLGEGNHLYPFDINVDSTAFMLDDNGTNLAFFVGDMMTTASVSLTVKATMSGIVNTTDGYIYLAGVPFNNVVVLTGFNSFPNANISYFDILGNNGTDEVNIIINATIPNPSSITSMCLGGVEYSLYYMNALIGYASTPNLCVTPGTETTIALQGILINYNNTVTEQLQSLFNNYIGGLPSLTTAVGVTLFGSTADIQWLQTVVTKYLRFNVTLPGMSGVLLIENIDIPMIDMVFDGIDMPLIGGHITAFVDFPFNFPMKFLATSMLFDMYNSNGFVIGSAFVPTSASTSNQELGQIYTQFPSPPSVVFNIVNDTAFSLMLNDVLNTKSTVFGLSGTVNGTFSSNLGIFTLFDITFDVSTITLAGMNGLNINSLTISDITGGSPTTISQSVLVVVDNPSEVTLTLGFVSFDLHYNGIYIGNASSNNFALPNIGSNVVNMNSIFFQQGAPIVYSSYSSMNPSTVLSGFDPAGNTARTFLSNFLMQQNQSITLVPSAYDGNVVYVKWLLYAMSNFKPLTIPVPGTTAPLVVQVTMEAAVSAGMASTKLQNIYSATVKNWWIDMTSSSYPNGGGIMYGQVQVNMVSIPMTILPRSQVCSVWETINNCCGTLSCISSMNIVGYIGIVIDEFVTYLPYSQNNINAICSICSLTCTLPTQGSQIGSC